jgi:hypothetical protein
MNLVQKEIIGKKQVCQRCSHEWVYKGSNPYVCTCPFCRTTVTLNKKSSLVEEGDIINATI